MGHSSSDLMNIPEGVDLDVSEVSDDDPFGASANWNDSYKRSDSARWNDSAVWNTSDDDESIQTAKSRVDEAFMQYTRVERAALQIQKNFRKKKLEREQLEDSTTQKDRNDTSDDDSDDSKKEDENEGRSYTLFMVALFALVPYIMMLAGCFTKCWGGEVDDVEGAPVEGIVDGTANGAPGGAPAPGGNGGGGGGGGAAPPPGLEAMAGQAAGAASGSAGAGASAGTFVGDSAIIGKYASKYQSLTKTTILRFTDRSCCRSSCSHFCRGHCHGSCWGYRCRSNNTSGSCGGCYFWCVFYYDGAACPYRLLFFLTKSCSLFE